MVLVLAKGEPNYVEIYEGDSLKRDLSYHQGPVWPWLLGLYYDALNFGFVNLSLPSLELNLAKPNLSRFCSIYRIILNIYHKIHEKLAPIYVLYGEEIFLLENCLKKIKKNFGETANGINYIQIDETNLNTLISEMQTPAFGYPRKLIVVKNAKLLKKEVKKRGSNADLISIREKLNDCICCNFYFTYVTYFF